VGPISGARPAQLGPSGLRTLQTEPLWENPRKCRSINGQSVNTPVHGVTPTDRDARNVGTPRVATLTMRNGERHSKLRTSDKTSGGKIRASTILVCLGGTVGLPSPHLSGVAAPKTRSPHSPVPRIFVATGCKRLATPLRAATVK
jgi:hypothetical protein